MKILFLLPISSQPRYHKRIRKFEELGVESVVFAFERKRIAGDKNFRYRSLGLVHSGRYWSRIPKLARAIPKVLRAVLDNDVIYAFGFDMAVLGLVASRALFKRNIKLVCEYGDIVPVMLSSSWRSKLFRWVERIVIRKSSKIVVTSPAYIREYFVKIQCQDERRFFVLENKIDRPIQKSLRKELWDGQRPLRIGYFGLLRDMNSWQVLVSLAENYPERFCICVYGYSRAIENFDQVVERNDNIVYGGEYVYPYDLPKLYEGVDIVLACFPKHKNIEGHEWWKWPMTNRFYESCYFHTPMITQEGSEDDRRAQEYGLGISVDIARPVESVNQLLSITPYDVKRWGIAFQKLSQDVYVYTNEHEQFIETIQ